MKYDVSKIRNPELRVLLDEYFADIEKRVYGVSTESTLAAALLDTSITDIHLLADITLTGTLTIARAVTIHGHGFKLSDSTLDANQYMACQITGEGVTLDNVKFNIDGNSDGNALYCIDVYAANTTIKNCTFETMTNAGSSGAVAVYYEAYTNHTLSNNTLANGVAITGSAELEVVKNNAFAASKGFGLGLAIVGKISYLEYSAAQYALLKAYLIAEGNSTTGEATGLVVDDYLAG